MQSASSIIPRIKALLFDVEGVIAHPDEAALDERLGAFTPGLDADRLRAARNTPETYELWKAYSCGHLDRAGYWGPILETLGIEPSLHAIQAVHAAQRDTWWAHLSAPVLEVARRARPARKVGLLSNSAPEHEAHIPRFAGLFDAVCFSHRMGLRKPDAPAYLEAARRLGAQPEEVVFIDDKERNIAAARRAGMFAVHFTDPSALVDSLMTFGVDVSAVETSGVETSGIEGAGAAMSPSVGVR